MLHSHPWWKFAIGDPAFLCFVWLKCCWRFVCSYRAVMKLTIRYRQHNPFFLPGHKHPDFCSEVGNFNKSVKSGSWLIFGADFKCLFFFIFGTSTSASFFQPQILLPFIKRTNRDVFGYRHGPISVKAAETRAAHIWLPRKSQPNRKKYIFLSLKNVVIMNFPEHTMIFFKCLVFKCTLTSV